VARLKAHTPAACRLSALIEVLGCRVNCVDNLMSYVVVHCGHCGRLFKSRKYVVRHPGIILGNLEGCPTCGQMAEVLDGVFDAAMTVIKLIDGPHMTRDLLEKFADLIAQTQREQITFDNLQHEAAKLNAKFGEAVASWYCILDWRALVGSPRPAIET
jgi:hypothetical protein